MKIEVELRAFPLCGKCNRTHLEDPKTPPDHELELAIREVEIEESDWHAVPLEGQLELVFYYGQNDFQPVKDRYSVSVGDIVRHPTAGRYRVAGFGFDKVEEGGN